MDGARRMRSVSGFAWMVMRYDGSALGFLTGLGLDTHLRRDIKAFLYYYIAFTPIPTKALSNYVVVLA